MIDFLSSYGELTASEKKALAYIMDHSSEIPHLTINELAKEAFVSKTVIINLTQKLGYSGYKELKFHINSTLRQEKQVAAEERVSTRENLSRSVEKTFSLVIDEQVAACARSLLQANNIFIMARGTSKPVGYYLEHLLFSMGMHCIFIKDYNLSASFANLVTDKDVVILMSLSGNTKKIIETAKQVHLKQAQIISMTSFQSSTLASYADQQLYCHTEELDTKYDDTISRIGFFLLTDLLVGTLKELRHQ